MPLQSRLKVPGVATTAKAPEPVVRDVSDWEVFTDEESESDASQNTVDFVVPPPPYKVDDPRPVFNRPTLGRPLTDRPIVERPVPEKRQSSWRSWLKRDT